MKKIMVILSIMSGYVHASERLFDSLGYLRWVNGGPLTEPTSVTQPVPTEVQQFLQMLQTLNQDEHGIIKIYFILFALTLIPGQQEQLEKLLENSEVYNFLQKYIQEKEGYLTTEGYFGGRLYGYNDVRINNERIVLLKKICEDSEESITQKLETFKQAALKLERFPNKKSFMRETAALGLLAADLSVLGQMAAGRDPFEAVRTAVIAATPFATMLLGDKLMNTFTSKSWF